MSSDGDRLLTVKQVARRGSFADSLSGASFAHCHIGRRVRIDPRDLAAFLERCR